MTQTICIQYKTITNKVVLSLKLEKKETNFKNSYSNCIGKKIEQYLFVLDLSRSFLEPMELLALETF